MPPSVDKSGVRCVDEIAGEFPHAGRDLIGDRTMRSLPWGTKGDVPTKV